MFRQHISQPERLCVVIFSAQPPAVTEAALHRLGILGGSGALLCLVCSQGTQLIFAADPDAFSVQSNHFIVPQATCGRGSWPPLCLLLVCYCLLYSVIVPAKHYLGNQGQQSSQLEKRLLQLFIDCIHTETEQWLYHENILHRVVFTDIVSKRKVTTIYYL